MTDDTIIHAFWMAGALVLVGSAVLHRRLSQRRALKLALIWLAIILAAWGGVAWIEHHHVLAHFT